MPLKIHNPAKSKLKLRFDQVPLGGFRLGLTDAIHINTDDPVKALEIVDKLLQECRRSFAVMKAMVEAERKSGE